MKQNEHEKKGTLTVKKRMYISILLSMLALVGVTAATVAWFSIADNTRVRTMSLDIMADVSLRMDLDAHSTIDQYVKTLSFRQIGNRIQQEKGFSFLDTPLQPVTTSDQSTFTFENGSVADPRSGAYLEFTLHFMAAEDMIVHLTSANSGDGQQDGTAILSKNPELPQAMRIAFTEGDTTWIYDPGMGDTASGSGKVKTFGLPSASAMKLTDTNTMFSLKKETDKAIQVHIWMEGTDPACTDSLKSADYAIRLRFTETTEDNKPFSENS